MDLSSVMRNRAMIFRRILAVLVLTATLPTPALAGGEPRLPRPGAVTPTAPAPRPAVGWQAVTLSAWSLANKRKVVMAAGALLLFSLALFPFLGKEFMPQLQEGSIMWRVTSIP
ncbi:MAG TPA: hypothetical protein VK971_02600, partial [Thiohalobacter sp.]|nr:hypothetical protein [Thiohalobacter sp.]